MPEELRATMLGGLVGWALDCFVVAIARAPTQVGIAFADDSSKAVLAGEWSYRSPENNQCDIYWLKKMFF